jgi:hypothetical protein
LLVLIVTGLSTKNKTLMASATSNNDRATDLTEAVITLQKTTRGFIEDAESGRQDFVLKRLSQQAADDGTPTILGLTSAEGEIGAQLKNLEDDLRTLEKQLRSQGRWQLSPHASGTETRTPTMLDISDLSHAINLLSHLITKTSPRKTPQPSLSIYSWTWDPAWHEFYTYIPSQQTYVYLSRWKLNEVRNVWEHVNMANTHLLPDAAAEMLGAWEDWVWDDVWQQWYLEVREEGTDEMCHLFPSQWQVQENGEWEYMGRIGQ